jgi:hypothetical protein
MAELVFGVEIGKKLCDAGVIPEGVDPVRIVIDINMDEPVTVYYQCHGDKQMIDLTIEELIKVKKRVTLCPTT